MSVKCPAGFLPDPNANLPSKPDKSSTLNKDGTYVRLKYEWKKADNESPASCGCGQKCAFNMTYGTTATGNISITPLGFGGGVGTGDIITTELSVEVGSEKYEYVGIKVFLEEIKETGTYETRGGFVKSGLYAKIKFAFRFLRYGPAAIIPAIQYNDPDKIETKQIKAAWKICRKPCS